KQKESAHAASSLIEWRRRRPKLFGDTGGRVTEFGHVSIDLAHPCAFSGNPSGGWRGLRGRPGPPRAAAAFDQLRGRFRADGRADDGARADLDRAYAADPRQRQAPPPLSRAAASSMKPRW